MWVKTLLTKRTRSFLPSDLQMEDCSVFKNFKRMNIEYFINIIGAKVARRDYNYRKCISVTEKLALTLSFLGTGDYFQSLMYQLKETIKI